MHPVSLTWQDVSRLSIGLAKRWNRRAISDVFAVPSGGAAPGVIVASLLDVPLTDAPTATSLIVDDLADSGATLQAFDLPHMDALIRKPHTPEHIAPKAHTIDAWVKFPWEHEPAPTDAIVRLLQYIGEDPTRDGLQDTPARVLRAWSELTAGYGDNAATHLARTFTGNSDQMIVQDGIQFVSMCEHHMLPFIGTARVGYLPGDRIVGLSKLARTVQVFARRLQIQERMTDQIADAIEHTLNPDGVGVTITATHLCMSIRGAQQPNTTTTTTALRGLLLTDAAAKQEFLNA